MCCDPKYSLLGLSSKQYGHSRESCHHVHFGPRMPVLQCRLSTQYIPNRGRDREDSSEDRHRNRDGAPRQ